MTTGYVQAANPNLTQILSCDFCGTLVDHEPTRRFIESPPSSASQAVICELCVMVCVGILAAATEPPAPPAASPDPDSTTQTKEEKP